MTGGTLVGFGSFIIMFVLVFLFFITLHVVYYGIRHLRKEKPKTKIDSTKRSKHTKHL